MLNTEIKKILVHSRSIYCMKLFEFVSWVTLQGFDRTPKIVFAIRYITLFFLLNF